MGLARGVERRLERLVDGLAARLFRGRVHPVELGSMLVRQADLALVDTPAGPTAPNAFTVTLGGDRVEPEVVELVGVELARFVEEAAVDRGWRLEGPARVTVEVAPGRDAEVAIAATVEPGPRDPWLLLHPVDAEGPPIPVSHIRAVVGRAADADAQVTSGEVSRRHALIWRESGSVWVADLGSTNGTYLNRHPVARPTEVVDGDQVAFGTATFTVRRP